MTYEIGQRVEVIVGRATPCLRKFIGKEATVIATRIGIYSLLIKADEGWAEWVHPDEIKAVVTA